MNKKAVKTEEDDEIDLLALLEAIKKSIVPILIIALACGIAAYCFTKLTVAPTYTTSFRVYVNNSNTAEEKTSVTNSDLTASRYLAATYGEIISGRTVLTTAADNIGYNASYSSLSKNVSVSASSTSEIISVSVTAASPELALQYAQSIIDVAEAQIAQIVDGSSMRVIDDPYLPTGRSGPSYTKSAAIGFVLGGFAICALVVVKELLDDRVKSEEVLEEKFGIPVIGTVPNYWSAMKTNDKYGYYGTEKKKKSRKEKQSNE